MENELKVGEFIRTKDGLIRKVKKIDILIYIDEVYISNEPEYHNSLIEDDIVKHSINIIDILKIGDFIYTDYGWGWYHHKVDEETIVIDDGDEFIDVKKDEIHRILTQEMLWDNSYEVGD